MTINSFKGKYEFLSNFYPCEVTYDGKKYPSIEHAFQAAKTESQLERIPFQSTSMSAAQSKKEGRKLTLRENWESVKISIMSCLLLEKFYWNPTLKAALLATGDHELVEGNWWGDTYWGICNGEGKNILGRLLMAIRDEQFPLLETVRDDD